MYKAIRFISFFATVVFIISSCSTSDDLVTHTNEHVDFYRYKSYSLLEWNTNNDSIVDEHTRERILYAIANELNLRGFHWNADGGDMRVAVHVLVDKKTAETQYHEYYKNQYGNNYETANMGFDQSKKRFEDYEFWEGTLLIDIFDAETKQLIWQGAKVNTLKQAASTEERNMRIERIVEETMQEFPIEKISTN